MTDGLYGYCACGRSCFSPGGKCDACKPDAAPRKPKRYKDGDSWTCPRCGGVSKWGDAHACLDATQAPPSTAAPLLQRLANRAVETESSEEPGDILVNSTAAPVSGAEAVVLGPERVRLDPTKLAAIVARVTGILAEEGDERVDRDTWMRAAKYWHCEYRKLEAKTAEPPRPEQAAPRTPLPVEGEPPEMGSPWYGEWASRVSDKMREPPRCECVDDVPHWTMGPLVCGRCGKHRVRPEPKSATEDRRAAHLRAHEPPPGYLVWNAGRANPPIGTPCTGWNAGTTLGEIHRTRTVAVAACWAHYDAHPAVAELTVLRECHAKECARSHAAEADLVRVRLGVEAWQREYGSACAREDEERVRADKLQGLLARAAEILKSAPAHPESIRGRLLADIEAALA